MEHAARGGPGYLIGSVEIGRAARGVAQEDSGNCDVIVCAQSTDKTRATDGEGDITTATGYARNGRV